jgi:hypothetical protein
MRPRYLPVNAALSPGRCPGRRGGSRLTGRKAQPILLAGRRSTGFGGDSIVFWHLLHLHTYTGGWGLGAVVLLGAGLVTTRAGRPILKGAIKGGLTAAAAVQGLTTGIVEGAQSIYSESRAELEATSDVPRRPRTAPAAPAAPAAPTAEESAPSAS